MCVLLEERFVVHWFVVHVCVAAAVVFVAVEPAPRVRREIFFAFFERIIDSETRKIYPPKIGLVRPKFDPLSPPGGPPLLLRVLARRGRWDIWPELT